MDSRGLLVVCLLALALALVAGCGGNATPKPQSGGESARVDSVRDGDTILLTNGLRVRLVQIDAPELAVECYGDEAARTLERLAPPGSAITLEEDPELDRIDRHGRLLRYGYVADRNLNLELVGLGAAAPYFFRGERGSYADALERAGRRARADRLGLWSRCPATSLVPHRTVTTGPVVEDQQP